MRGRCEARVQIPGLGGKSHACPFAAKHHHRLDNGRTIHVCGPHYRALLRRIRLGSADQMLANWGRAATPNR